VLALRCARLLPGERLPPVERAILLLDGGKVVAVGSDDAPGRSLPRLVDLGDVTLMPGLVDAHVHLCFDDDHPLGPVDADDADVLAVMHANAVRQLQAGVTTVRDLGDARFLGVELRRRYAAGHLVGPHLLAAGPPVTPAGGHCSFLGGEADGLHGVRAAVAERARRGCDVVKIMATGGFSTPGIPPDASQYGPSELSAAAQDAHGQGLPLAAHAHGRQGIVDSLAAGADTIEHCSFVAGDRVHVDWTVVDQLAEAGVHVGMTVALHPDAPPTDALSRHVGEVLENMARMHRAGVRIVASSDAGTSPWRPHGVLPHAVLMLASHGVSPADAIDAATGVAADACGLGHRKGRIAPGYDADLLGVEGDPLRDIEAILAVRVVYRAGVRWR